MSYYQEVEKIDETAGWQSWLHEHGPKLILLARQWVNCQADAEDVLQEAFVRFWQHRDDARDPSAYLYQCVRNTASNWIRGSSTRKRHEQAAADQPMFVTPVAPAEEAEWQAALEAALADLPLEQREVVVMRFWGELKFSVIAEVLETPRSTVHARYQAGLAALEERLDEEWFE